ncbi:MAG: alpha/beta fold hydrolase [Crocinitomicaceae bacterium]|nr:alpha/beta fold hydrolase [Crocinitomicaceae bacterium]
MRDLILLHGALGASSEFNRLTPLLSSHFNVHTFDFSGHGKNNTDKAFSMDLFAQDLNNFITTRKLDKPQVFGYSMGGYVAYKYAINSGDKLGDIMSLGTKLKWDPLTSKVETAKLNPAKIEEKVPKFAAYLDSLHNNWRKNMEQTVLMMTDLGNGAALDIENFAQIKNKCYIGLGDMDEMVTCAETQAVAQAIPNSEYYLLEKSRHPLVQLDVHTLADKIIAHLK